MGKLTDALKKAAQERLSRIERLDGKNEVKYEFIAKKTLDSKIDPRIIAFYDPKSPISEQYPCAPISRLLIQKHPLKPSPSPVHRIAKARPSLL